MADEPTATPAGGDSTPVTGEPTGASPTPDPAVEPKDGVQKRIDELTRKRREAEQDAAYWRGKAEAQPVSPSPTVPTGGDEELDPDDFDTYSDYLKAMAKKTQNEIRAEAQAEKDRERKTKQSKVMVEQYTKARTKYSDFDSVALDRTLPITQTMFDASIGDSLGDILYHLGKNSDEASRIASLSPTQQIKEIAKIESKLTVTPPNPITNAPNPPTTVGGGGGSPPSKPDDKKSRAELHAEWEKNRRKRMLGEQNG